MHQKLFLQKPGHLKKNILAERIFKLHALTGTKPGHTDPIPGEAPRASSSPAVLTVVRRGPGWVGGSQVHQGPGGTLKKKSPFQGQELVVEQHRVTPLLLTPES